MQHSIFCSNEIQYGLNIASSAMACHSNIDVKRTYFKSMHSLKKENIHWSVLFLQMEQQISHMAIRHLEFQLESFTKESPLQQPWYVHDRYISVTGWLDYFLVGCIWNFKS